MNKILIITLIIYSYCRNSEYYAKCLDGAPTYDNNKHSVSECNEYKKEGSYCCLLSFKIYEETTQIYLNLGSYFKKKPSIRALDEKEYLCIRISKDGYYKISDVKKDIEKETGVSELTIDCNSNKLNILLLLTYLLLFLLI